MTDNYDYDHAIMFRVFFDENPEEWLWDWMGDWLDEWNDWTGERGPNDLPTLSEPVVEERDAHYMASWWFSWGHDRDAIYDPLIEPDGSSQEGTLEDACSWARVLYHDCTHPSDNPDPCSWDDQRDHGQVPDHITSQ